MANAYLATLIFYAFLFATNQFLYNCALPGLRTAEWQEDNEEKDKFQERHSVACLQRSHHFQHPRSCFACESAVFPKIGEKISYTMQQRNFLLHFL